MYRADQVDAFFSKIDITPNKAECWEWKGAKTSRGYGNVGINKKNIGAHRMVWQLINGNIPKNLVVMHLCDNPACCNVNHLVLGTMKQNTLDMMMKKRDGFQKNRAVGSRNANAKLNNKKVADIRREYLSGKTQYELADKYNVTQTTISCITLNKTWRHVA